METIAPPTQEQVSEAARQLAYRRHHWNPLRMGRASNAGRVLETWRFRKAKQAAKNS